jgi:hypothetical protein
MFAKLARFRGLNPRHAAQSKAAPCNDNHPVRRLTVVAPRAPRRILVCGWRQVAATGRLECYWHVVAVGAAPAEEPGISWSTDGVCRHQHGIRILFGLSVGAPARQYLLLYNML